MSEQQYDISFNLWDKVPVFGVINYNLRLRKNIDRVDLNEANLKLVQLYSLNFLGVILTGFLTTGLEKFLQ